MYCFLHFVRSICSVVNVATKIDNLKYWDVLEDVNVKSLIVLKIEEEYFNYADTFNLTVAGVHTFYVEKNGISILVHNTGTGKNQQEFKEYWVEGNNNLINNIQNRRNEKKKNEQKQSSNTNNSGNEKREFNQHSGGKNAKHANVNARQVAENDWLAAKEEMADARARGATKAEKAEIQKRIDHAKRKMDFTGESHSGKAKGSQGGGKCN